MKFRLGAFLLITLTVSAFAKETIDVETHISTLCKTLTGDMTRIRTGSFRPERDLAGHIRFVMSHGSVHGDKLTPEQAEAKIRAVLKDPEGNVFKSSTRDGVSYFVPEGLERYQFTKYEDAVMASEIMRGFDDKQKKTWTNVQKKMDDIIIDLTGSAKPKPGDSDAKAAFYKELRRKTLVHIMIQLRLAEQTNTNDCVLRGMRDLYFDESIRARPEFKWLADLYKQTQGNYSRLTHLTPPYDKEQN